MTFIQPMEDFALKNKDQVKIGGAATFDSYERMPIQDFGKNLLKKLGWDESKPKPLGKNTTYEEYKEPNFNKLMPRQSRLGLGAKPLTHDQAKKLNKNGNTNIIVAGTAQDNKHEIKVGSIVMIIDGSHEGKQGKVL